MPSGMGFQPMVGHGQDGRATHRLLTLTLFGDGLGGTLLLFAALDGGVAGR